ncbi:MAG: UDP-N-acetylglucosamine 2-epimerase (non-hydrolyzing) [Nitrososphaerota archaeon]|nr:UDP-N-acetylglucosamine 2-epimerase (non-hydrolyzing) [Nitrososphaerota archaeon]
MKRLKVLTTVGTRPEIIRLSRVIAKLDDYEAIDHVLVHTGQNYDYELNQVFFEDLEIRKPNYFLNAAAANGSITIGNVISKMDEILESQNPDAFLVLGDTNSCLGAIPAKRRHIPVFHMEAGNRCFDDRVPEETNRKVVDHISDINMPYSSIAREYLLREGLAPDRIVKTGSPMYEVLQYYSPGIERSPILSTLGLMPEQYILVSSHREENVSDRQNLQRFLNLLNTVAERFNLPVIVSTHPRTMKAIISMPREVNPLIRLLKPFGYFDYVQLQISSKVVLSDSGTISEEASILNFPALNLREAHERPEAMEEGTAMLVGYNLDRVLQGISILEHQFRREIRGTRLVADYNSPNVSEKVLRIILSYTDYVNRVVWRKP